MTNERFYHSVVFTLAEKALFDKRTMSPFLYMAKTETFLKLQKTKLWFP